MSIDSSNTFLTFKQWQHRQITVKTPDLEEEHGILKIEAVRLQKI